MTFDKVQTPELKKGNERSLKMFALVPTCVLKDGKEVFVLFEHYTEHQICAWGRGLFGEDKLVWKTYKKVLS